MSVSVSKENLNDVKKNVILRGKNYFSDCFVQYYGILQFFESETSQNGEHFKELKAEGMSDTDSFVLPNVQLNLAPAIE